MSIDYLNRNEDTKNGVGFPQLLGSDKLWLWRYEAAQMGFSNLKLAKLAHVRKDSVTHFFHGRNDRAGKRNVKAIKSALTKLGIIEPKSKSKQVVNQAGLTMGALRVMTRDFAKARNVQSKSQENKHGKEE